MEILTKVFGFPKKFLHEWQEEFEITENVSDKPNSENDITNSTNIFDVDFNIDIKNEVDLDSFEEITEKENDITSTKISSADFNVDIKNEVDLDSIEEGLSNPIVVPFKPKKFNSDDIKETSQSVMPFKCKNCDAGFMKKMNLKRHIKVIHEEGETYNCGTCNDNFTRKGNMKKHITTVHKGQKQNLNGIDSKFEKVFNEGKSSSDSLMDMSTGYLIAK